jgi:microcin C transport system permease protein
MSPGGHLYQKIQAIRYGVGGGDGGGSGRASAEINKQIIEELRRQYGFDKPISVRYYLWIKNILKMDFGNSTTYEEPVLDVILSRFPVSMQFGLAAYFFSYLFCIPLGMLLANKANTLIDRSVQSILFTLYAVPPLIFGIILIVMFASSSHFDWFPIGGYISDHYADLSLWGKIQDRIYHFILPLFVYVLGGFTTQTMLMRNSMLEVIHQDFIRTAKAKGLSPWKVQIKHSLRNAMIPMVTGMGSFLSVFLSGSLIIETVFRLDGIGLLSYKALMTRDYNLIMGIIFLSSVLLMLGRLISDILYVMVDPRIDFA